MDDETDNVVQLKSHALRPAMTIVRADGCIAHKLEIDEAKRAIKCTACGRVLDPFDAMLHVAANWKRYAQNLTALQHESARLLAERDKLKREIVNLKATKRRAAP